MISNNNKIFFIGEKFVSDKQTVFQAVRQSKFIFNISYDIFDSTHEKLLYICKKDKFYDAYNTPLFEYKLKNTAFNCTLKINNQEISIKKKTIASTYIEFVNKATNTREEFKFRSHFLKKDYEIYDTKTSSVICEIKKNGMFSSNYTITIEKDVDVVFVLLCCFVSINILERTKAVVAAAGS